jgi:hypothetical protein
MTSSMVSIYNLGLRRDIIITETLIDDTINLNNKT